MFDFNIISEIYFYKYLEKKQAHLDLQHLRKTMIRQLQSLLGILQ